MLKTCRSSGFYITSLLGVFPGLSKGVIEVVSILVLNPRPPAQLLEAAMYASSLRAYVGAVDVRHVLSG